MQAIIKLICKVDSRSYPFLQGKYKLSISIYLLIIDIFSNIGRRKDFQFAKMMHKTVAYKLRQQFTLSEAMVRGLRRERSEYN